MVLFTPGVFYSKYLPFKKKCSNKVTFFPPPISYDKQDDRKNGYFRYVIANQKSTQQTMIEAKIQREGF